MAYYAAEYSTTRSEVGRLLEVEITKNTQPHDSIGWWFSVEQWKCVAKV